MGTINQAMNSKQRRKDRRAWKYEIDLGSRSYNDYLDMWNWLAHRHGIFINLCGWRAKAEVNLKTDDEYFLVWQFLRRRDAVEFALKWS